MSPALAIGSDRRAAAQVFGPYFDDLVLTTFEDRDHDTSGRTVSFVGVTGEEGSLDSVRWALARSEQDPTLQVAIEVPDDHGRNRALREVLAPYAASVRGIETYDGRACVVIGGTAEVTPGSDPLFDGLFDAVLAPTVRVRAEQESLARTWETAAARTRATEFEVALDEATSKLNRARGEVKDLSERLDHLRQVRARDKERLEELEALHPQAPKRRPRPQAEATPPPPPLLRRVAYAASGMLGAQGRRGRTLTLLVLAAAGVLPAVVLAVLLGLVDGFGGVVTGLALGVVIGLVALAVVVGVFAARTANRVRVETQDQHRQLSQQLAGVRRKQADLLERRLATLEVLLADQAELLERLPTDRPLTPHAADRLLNQTGDRVQSTLQLLERVPTTEAVPPMSGYAAAPDVILLLVDTLLREKPALVVECGSGTSTLFLALAARQAGLPTRIVSLEHERPYADATRALLERHGVADRAEVRNAPLARTSLSDHTSPWYDERAVADLEGIGLLFVDGPPASVGPQSRRPAVPLLRDRFAASATIVLDDSARPDERAIADAWAPQLEGFRYDYLPLIRGAAVFHR